jgi:hypothetical protein
LCLGVPDGVSRTAAFTNDAVVSVTPAFKQKSTD